MAHFGFPLETLIIFFAVVSFSVYLDLVMHRNVRDITVAEAARWTVFWVVLALCFYVYLWLRFNREWADLYLAGLLMMLCGGVRCSPLSHSGRGGSSISGTALLRSTR
ncbi:hypothetical protein FACS1894116_14300 [Betaproteobacteria bacterium]|nr:hypothetical protein FACS1894116_14300 [Betaproteobacteria bacterium]